jgi:cysteinyl-tRNA synthetase
MVDLGISVEDRGGNEDRALVKLVDRLTLIEAREDKIKRESEKAREKAERALALEAKRLERIEKGRTHPKDMFRTAEFSAWDEEGLPTLDAAGQEISKSRRKKAEKEAGAQAKLHAEFLAEASKQGKK